MNSKNRILFLMKLMNELTDSEHPVSTNDIIQEFKSKNVIIDRKTVKTDIEILKDFGIDIVSIKSSPNKYFVDKRNFEISELKLLVDAVQSSKFITQDKSQLLINKINKLTSRNQAEKLKRHLFVPDKNKSTDEKIYEFIDTINDAINQSKKISFKYIDYTNENKVTLKNNGELYKLTPYSIVWNSDYYFVVGFSDKHKKIGQLRVDRMYNPKISIENGIERPWDFNVDEYINRIFRTNNGEIAIVELL